MPVNRGGQSRFAAALQPMRIAVGQATPSQRAPSCRHIPNLMDCLSRRFRRLWPRAWRLYMPLSHAPCFYSVIFCSLSVDQGSLEISILPPMQREFLVKLNGEIQSYPPASLGFGRMAITFASRAGNHGFMYASCATERSLVPLQF